MQIADPPTYDGAVWRMSDIEALIFIAIVAIMVALARLGGMAAVIYGSRLFGAVFTSPKCEETL
jgi:hypothetical protein